MLTDGAIKALKPREKVYKIADRDGMYAAVTPKGTVSFRYDYRPHGRRETLIIGTYGKDGLTLAVARERCLAAREMVAAGQLPAQENQRARHRLAGSRGSRPIRVAITPPDKVAEVEQESGAIVVTPSRELDSREREPGR